MAARLTAALLSWAACIAYAIALLLAMLLAMNGYSESDAMWGLAAFAISVLLISGGMAVGASYFVSYLARKNWHPAISVPLSALIFTVVGAILETAASIAGIGIAEVVRVKF